MPAENSYAARTLVAVDGHAAGGQFGNAPIGIDTSGNVSVTATTASTSTITGALVVPGGVGISGDFNAAGKISSIVAYYFGAVLAFQTTGTYNVFYDFNGTPRLFLGPAGDPNDYFAATAHTFRDLTNSIDYASIGATGYSSTLDIAGKSIKISTVAVASLPAAAAGNKGMSMMVSDATATTFWSIVAGSGANIIRVTSDGTNWRIG